jgi:hypothetical protein
MKKYEVEVIRGAQTESVFIVHVDLVAVLNLFTAAYGDYGIKEVKYMEDVAQDYPSMEYNFGIECLLRNPNV